MTHYCHEMREGEILNQSASEYPLFHGVLYGSKVATAKFSKRLSCSIKHLPLRLSFDYEYNTLRSIEAGISQDPTLVLDGSIFIEGLVQAEEITEKILKLLSDS